MGVLFTNASLQNLDYGAFPQSSSYHQKSWVLWFIKTADANSGLFAHLIPNNVTVDNNWAIYTRTTGKIRFHYAWTTATGNIGAWDSDVVSNNALKQLVITYDDSSSANVPVMYVNGVSVTVTTVNSPSGISPSGTNNTLKIGSSSATNGFDGTLFGFCLYNRILSASEILESYNSKLVIPSYRGLIFAPQLWNIKDGLALSSSNIVKDLINGISGTPSGSPIGKADNYLTIEGIN